ncbi:hypothetical protein ACFLXI_02735 [Chloroflexota bacterium]
MFMRIGYFFIIVSLIVLFAFVASYQVDNPDYSLLLGGCALLFIGIFMVIRNRRPSEKAERFRMVHKARSRKNKNGEEPQ